MKRVVLVVLAAMTLTGCPQFTRVDSPISFKADRRLSIKSPDQEAEVRLPIEVRWEADDFRLAGGNHFGLFVDRAPIGTDKLMRLRVCTDREKLPPQLGEFRSVCKDDRQKIFFSDEPAYSFKCFEPRFSAPKRERNTHTVTVILLDRENRRVGQAASTVRFEVDEDDALKCRGL